MSKNSTGETMVTYDHRTVFEGPIIHVEEMEVDLPACGCHTFQIVRHPGGAAVLPVHNDGFVSLIRQLRPAVGIYLLEIPAGRLSPDEAPAACAERELREETGLRAARLVSLGVVHSSPGVFDEIVHLFAAIDSTQGMAEPEADEEIEVVRLPLSEALQMAADGRISDAKTLAALLRWELSCRTPAT